MSQQGRRSLAQPLGGLGEAAGAEGALDQAGDQARVLRLFADQAGRSRRGGPAGARDAVMAVTMGKKDRSDPEL